jgi:hypothetical protein
MRMFDIKAYPLKGRRATCHLDPAVLAPGARFDERRYSRSLGVCLGACGKYGDCPFGGCRASASALESGHIVRNTVTLH